MRWAFSSGSRSSQWSTSTMGTTSAWPCWSGLIDRNDTHRSSRHTKRPGRSPSMIMVNTVAMAASVSPRIRRRSVVSAHGRPTHADPPRSRSDPRQQRGPDLHHPEHHHDGPAVHAAGLRVPALRPGRPVRGRLGAGRHRRHRLGRRLPGPPAEPGLQRRQDPRSGRRPAAVLRRRRVDPHRRVGARCGSPCSSWSARWSSPSPRWRWPRLGARRIDVTWAGKTATFLLMGAFPAFLVGHSDAHDGRGLRRPWPGRRPSPGIVLSYYSAAHVHPAGPQGPGRRAGPIGRDAAARDATSA